MLNHFIRYMCGYLRIRITGNNVERFVNTCSYKGIRLWNLSSANSSYEMNILIKDFKNIKPVIRKTRTKVLIVKRTGFPFFIQKHHRQKLFFAGIFIFLLLIYLLSNHVWEINVAGNSTYTTENILSYLDSTDIQRGMKCSKVDCIKINRQIRQHYDNIIWVSTSLNGSCLNIEIKENEDSFVNKDTNSKSNEPYDIIADANCIITKIVVRNGIIKIKEGDSVKKGSLLISGQIPIYNDAKEITGYQYCISDADIYGKTTLSYSDELPISASEKEYYNIEKSAYCIRIGNYRFTLGSKQNDYKYFETYQEGKDLDTFSFGFYKIRPYKVIQKNYTNKQIHLMLSTNFQHYCNELKKKGVVILQNDVKIYTWSDKAKAQGTLTIEMPIGRKVKSEIIETGDQIDGNDGNNN